MKIIISKLQQGDVFRHPNFNFNLTTDFKFISGNDMLPCEVVIKEIDPKTGDHIFFEGEQLNDEVTLVSYANPVYGR